MVCKHVALESKGHVTVNSCQQIYCIDCTRLMIDNNSTCFCQGPSNINTLKPSRLSSKNIHSSLEFTCPYCATDVVVSNIDRHIETCRRFPKCAGISRGTNTEIRGLLSTPARESRERDDHIRYVWNVRIKL